MYCNKRRMNESKLHRIKNQAFSIFMLFWLLQSWQSRCMEGKRLPAKNSPDLITITPTEEKIKMVFISVWRNGIQIPQHIHSAMLIPTKIEQQTQLVKEKCVPNSFPTEMETNIYIVCIIQETDNGQNEIRSVHRCH